MTNPNAATTTASRDTRHYIAMSGSFGCTPDHCEVHPEKSDAVNDLVEMFELRRRQVWMIRNTGFLELDANDGADYCEVTSCNCEEPWIHSDSMTESEYLREYMPDELPRDRSGLRFEGIPTTMDGMSLFALEVTN